MAMNQLRQYGAADPAVAGRLRGLLHELACCDRKGQYRREIKDHLDRMRYAISVGDYSDPERKKLLGIHRRLHKNPADIEPVLRKMKRSALLRAPIALSRALLFGSDEGAPRGYWLVKCRVMSH